jgi:hypothetical protein
VFSLCAIVLQSSPSSHVSTSNGQRSSPLFCVHYSKQTNSTVHESMVWESALLKAVSSQGTGQTDAPSKPNTPYHLSSSRQIYALVLARTGVTANRNIHQAGHTCYNTVQPTVRERCVVTHRADNGSNMHLRNVGQFLRDYMA